MFSSIGDILAISSAKMTPKKPEEASETDLFRNELSNLLITTTSCTDWPV